MDQRQTLLAQWITQQLRLNQNYQGPDLCLIPVSGDASFRRYFRAEYVSTVGKASVIAVDSPPKSENNAQFVGLAQRFAETGVRVPRVLAVAYDLGFMMLTDLGDQLLLPLLTSRTVDAYYDQAMDCLLQLMSVDFPPQALPSYDADLLEREMLLFQQWFCGDYLGLGLTAGEQALLRQVVIYLRDEALSQPQVPVHRDYHSRNLMVLGDGELAMIDFQDAVRGPVTYDLLSLLRDAYVSWPQQQVQQWVQQFNQRLRQRGLVDVSDQQYWYWFNVIGAQRHLKVAGIFARLCFRDAKCGYLRDIPLTLAYLDEECQFLARQGVRVVEEFQAWMMQRVMPEMRNKAAQTAGQC